jgi:hypothetical protein
MASGDKRLQYVKARVVISFAKQGDTKFEKVDESER